MLNLKAALEGDVRAGLEAALGAGELAGVGDIPKIVIERPQAERGDYASPIALALAKKTGKKPLEIVEIIAKHMPKKEYVGRLKGEEPGFLNIYLNPGWLTARLDDITEQDICADIGVGAGKSVNLEFISANPTGPLTLGNVRTAFTADTLGNVLECAGYNVTREYYFNDAGEQIRKLGQSAARRELQARGEDVSYADDLYQGDYVRDVAAVIAEKLRENEGKELVVVDLEDAAMIERVGREAAVLLMTEIKKMISEDLKIEFDSWISEQQIRESGAVDEVLEKLKAVGDVYEKDGALWFAARKYGDEKDKVLVKSGGEYAYITPDLGYHKDKFDRGFDYIFTFLGADHQDQVSKIRGAMRSLGYDVDKLYFPIGQWFRLIRDGKPVTLSKRAGHIATPRDLIAEVGYDAARFFMVQHKLDTHMDFDLNLAKERSDKNPVYYVQYAYVRLQSILRRAKQEGMIEHLGMHVEAAERPALTHTLELELMRQLYRLAEVIADIAVSFEAHRLAYYAQDLAKSVHVFYKHVPVLATEDKNILRSRLQLVYAAREVLSRTLNLLGVSKPEVM